MNFKILLFAAVTLLNAGCTAKKRLSDNLQRQWMLIEFNGFKRDEIVQRRAFIDFSPTKSPVNEYTGMMGCNKIFFHTEVKIDSIKFTNIETTNESCNDDKVLQNAFIQNLPQMKTYNVDGHFLTLYSKNGARMKFIAADWD